RGDDDLPAAGWIASTSHTAMPPRSVTLPATPAGAMQAAKTRWPSCVLAIQTLRPCKRPPLSLHWAETLDASSSGITWHLTTDSSIKSPTVPTSTSSPNRTASAASDFCYYPLSTTVKTKPHETWDLYATNRHPEIIEIFTC